MLTVPCSDQDSLLRRDELLLHSPLQVRLSYQVADCRTLGLDGYLAAAAFIGL